MSSKDRRSSSDKLSVEVIERLQNEVERSAGLAGSVLQDIDRTDVIICKYFDCIANVQKILLEMTHATDQLHIDEKISLSVNLSTGFLFCTPCLQGSEERIANYVLDCLHGMQGLMEVVADSIKAPIREMFCQILMDLCKRFQSVPNGFSTRIIYAILVRAVNYIYEEEENADSDSRIISSFSKCLYILGKNSDIIVSVNTANNCSSISLQEAILTK